MKVVAHPSYSSCDYDILQFKRRFTQSILIGCRLNTKGPDDAAFFLSLKQMANKRYSDKELPVFLWIFLPYSAGMNAIVLGDRLFASVGALLINFALFSVYLIPIYMAFRLVAAVIHKRFPASNELFKRMGIMLPMFYTMNILLVTGLYGLYDLLPTAVSQPKTDNFFWAIAYACFSSTMITFLSEGIIAWKRWKSSLTDMEQLRNAYRRTRLLGLKGQINPHFLFNCFNSLSSLIEEDGDQAEHFLDEMTRVHRYMLRGDEEELIPVAEELRFARAYLYLTRVRFGDAISASINVDQALFTEKCLPPLSLQAILENIIYTNVASKTSPLRLDISNSADQLVIRNSVCPKTARTDGAADEGLDNLILKYRLLHVTEVSVHETPQERTILLPLLRKKEGLQ